MSANPHEPTCEEICNLLRSCTPPERDRLLINAKFIDAACVSIAECERVASHFTGREIRAGVRQPSEIQDL